MNEDLRSLRPGGRSELCALGSSEATPTVTLKQGNWGQYHVINGESAPGNALEKRHLDWGPPLLFCVFVLLGKTETVKATDTWASPIPP